MIDENVVKAIPGLSPAPNPGSLKNKEITGSKMGHTKKIFKKKLR
jgi:hypothetical protein